VHASAVHAARLRLGPGADPGGPGAAITVDLCGHWEHEGVCRWPHQTETVDDGEGVTSIRTVFVGDTTELGAIHDRIAGALGRGTVDGPLGTATWSVLDDGPADPTIDEADLAARWIAQAAAGA
jgi:hypothetical protein